MTERDSWLAIYDAAVLAKTTAGTDASPNKIIGRSITYIVNRLVDFWGQHKATLIPVLSQLAIAALEAVVTARPAIQQVNPPGPP